MPDAEQAGERGVEQEGRGPSDAQTLPYARRNLPENRPKHSRLMILVLSGGVVTLILGALFASCFFTAPRDRGRGRALCAANLAALGAAVRMYLEENGVAPADLVAIDKHRLPDRALKCPHLTTTSDRQCDYTYFRLPAAALKDPGSIIAYHDHGDTGWAVFGDGHVELFKKRAFEVALRRFRQSLAEAGTEFEEIPPGPR